MVLRGHLDGDDGRLDDGAAGGEGGGGLVEGVDGADVALDALGLQHLQPGARQMGRESSARFLSDKMA